MNIFKKKIKTYIVGFFILFSLLLLFFVSYVFGAYSYSRSLWPIILLKQQKKNIEYMLTGLKFDNKTNRLIKDDLKKQVPCPKQNHDTAVLFALGQSNVANHGEYKFTTNHPGKVVNYFNGKCFVASSPLLGSTNMNGEFITPLADNLIERGLYKYIVIILK